MEPYLLQGLSQTLQSVLACRQPRICSAQTPPSSSSSGGSAARSRTCWRTAFRPASAIFTSPLANSVSGRGGRARQPPDSRPRGWEEKPQRVLPAEIVTRHLHLQGKATSRAGGVGPTVTQALLDPAEQLFDVFTPELGVLQGRLDAALTFDQHLVRLLNCNGTNPRSPRAASGRGGISRAVKYSETTIKKKKRSFAERHHCRARESQLILPFELNIFL